MTVTHYEVRLCPNCGLRYPLTEGHPFGVRCPSCLEMTQVTLEREISALPITKNRSARGDSILFALLENLRSAWNVGSIFRTSEGLGVRKLYLCGITPTPENEAVRKTSLGAETSLDWEYTRNALDLAQKLKVDGHYLIALEQDERAVSITTAQFPLSSFKMPVLIVGNEVTGVDPEILDLCDLILYIPMQGKKHSFNVEVAFAITAFQLLNWQLQE